MFGMGEGRDGETNRCRDIGACEGSMVATRTRWRVESSLICGSDVPMAGERDSLGLKAEECGGTRPSARSRRFSSSSSATLLSR